MGSAQFSSWTVSIQGFGRQAEQPLIFDKNLFFFAKKLDVSLISVILIDITLKLTQ